MFSIVPVEAVILIVISVVPVIFHAKCLGFKKTVFSFETMMISGLLFLSLMTWRNELLLLGILMIVYSTWCWKLEPKCKASLKMLSRIVLFLISVVALEFGAVLFYSTLSATDQKSISIERATVATSDVPIVLNGSDSTSNPYGFNIAEAIVSKIVTANAARAFESSLLSNKAASGNMIAQGQSAPCRLAIKIPRNGKPNRNLISRLSMYFSINSQETARHRISSARGIDRRL